MKSGMMQKPNIVKEMLAWIGFSTQEVDEIHKIQMGQWMQQCAKTFPMYGTVAGSHVEVKFSICENYSDNLCSYIYIEIKKTFSFKLSVILGKLWQKFNILFAFVSRGTDP
jgi:hypothetical protein